MKANWYEWQRDAARYVHGHLHGGCIIPIKSPRQCGKTYWISTMAVWYATTSDPAVTTRASRREVMIVAPTYKQTKKIMKALHKQYRSKIRRYNQSDFLVELRNGAIIRGMSAKQGENLRGYTNDILFVDEGAYITDDVYEALLPTIQKRNGSMVITSTPNFCYGFYYDNYISSEDSIDWCSYDLSGVLTPEIKAKFKKIFTPQRYRTEVLGEFMANLSAVFGDFSKAIEDAPDMSMGADTFGIDWGAGVGGDYTAVSIFNKRKQMIDIQYWNDLEQDESIARIISYIQAYRPRQIVVETNSIGTLYMKSLRKAIYAQNISTTIRGFNTSNTSKRKIIDNLILNIERGSVTLLPDLELQKEMNNFQVKVSPVSMVKVYGAAQGFHDDLVMATAIGLNAMQTSYTVL